MRRKFRLGQGEENPSPIRNTRGEFDGKNDALAEMAAIYTLKKLDLNHGITDADK